MSNLSVYSNRSSFTDGFSVSTNSSAVRQKSASHLALQASRALNRRKQEMQRKNKQQVPSENKGSLLSATFSPAAHPKPPAKFSPLLLSDPKVIDRYDVGGSMKTPRASPRHGPKGSPFSSPRSKHRRGKNENREDILRNDTDPVLFSRGEREDPPSSDESAVVSSPYGENPQDESMVTSSLHGSEEDEESVTPPLLPISWENEEDFKAFEKHMKLPHNRLERLLNTIKDENTSSSHRVNACGALKTLTASKKNRTRLARTWGVVTGLSTLMCNKKSTVEERLRCMTALLHLCIPKQNWRIVYCSRGFAQALTSGISDDYPKVRHTACMCLELLAKSEANIVSIVHNDNIIEAASNMVGYALEYYGAEEDNDVLSSSNDITAMKGARMSVLRAFLLIAKSRQVSYQIARSHLITDVLVGVSGSMEAETNAVCTAVMMNMTRLPDNAMHIVFQMPDFVTSLVKAIDSDNDDCSRCALYGLQNLSCNSACRQELGNTPNLLVTVTRKAFGSTSNDQRLAAMHTLKNLSDDPSNLISMTNTPGCVATLLALTNEKGDEMLRYLACDTIAHLAHWLQSSAQKGSDLEWANSNQLPTLEQAVWEQWK